MSIRYGVNVGGDLTSVADLRQVGATLVRRPIYVNRQGDPLPELVTWTTMLVNASIQPLLVCGSEALTDDSAQWPVRLAAIRRKA